MQTYSDQMVDWLVEEGFTHCFFVAGGNIMHILNSVRKRLKCVPVVHEVTAGIAAEYFNELSTNGEKAFALVTAGPGLTNVITAMASAHMESRSLLVIGGQVKSEDLSHGAVRQRGIQEIDGVELVKSICKAAIRIEKPIKKSEFIDIIKVTEKSRKGVVFIEICLDAQGVNVDSMLEDADVQQLPEPKNIEGYTTEILNSLSIANRPVLLIGGGISRQTSSRLLKELELSGIPIMTTWNGADRYPHSPRNYWGRPNTWGMRYANILIQQSDLVIALGTRLGLQQTGFNWKEFVPFGKVIQVDIDAHELSKGHPAIHIGIEADANLILTDLVSKINIKSNHFAEWLEFGDKVKNYFPLSEAINGKFTGYWNPYDFVLEISSKLQSGDSLIPSSSGSAETVTMQAALLAEGVKVVTDKGMASMGYGLGGAIGAAFQSNGRVIHIEGDGGFSQNLQDLATVAINQLNIKIFILDNGGYASIRMTQMNYFDGAFIGCDSDSGLGMPNWQKLFDAYGIPVVQLSPEVGFNKEILSKLTSESPQAFIVPIHPEQTYFPKITSRVLGDGKMQSNPLHDMTPELTETEKVTFLRYLKP